MQGKPKKSQREKDLTSRYLSGGYDEDREDSGDRFSPKNKAKDRARLERTAIMRAEEQPGVDIDTLPIAQVVQVHSRFSEIRHEGTVYLAGMRRTLTKVSDEYVVVGDQVRFRADDGALAKIEALKHLATVALRRDMPEAVIEKILPRSTILTRSDSFKALEQHPIVANAEQMLIVASLRFPRVKWGLIDRMLVAAQCGNLKSILCMNKMDLIAPEEQEDDDVVQANIALANYESLGVRVLRTSVDANTGIDELRDILRGRETVLAGHSGVGKSTLINAVQPNLKLRTGAISGFNDKGRHTTTSARRYPLEIGGAVIDTPGVKLFGLWGLTSENLAQHFPDVTAGTAPSWRQESYERIRASLG